jgi:hypothetical protein
MPALQRLAVDHGAPEGWIKKVQALMRGRPLVLDVEEED